MKIKDISIEDIREGRNWRVLNPDAVQEDDFPMEDLEIEPLGEYDPSDQLVYSGIWIYLKGIGEPRTGLLDRLLGRGKRREDCRYPPEDPADLAPDAVPVVEPLVMIKVVQEAGWDYCELVEGKWRQLGLVPNKNAPLSQSYMANPVEDDTEFDIVPEDESLRDFNMRCFRLWIPYLGK